MAIDQVKQLSIKDGEVKSRHLDGEVFGNLSQDILPSEDITYDIGSPTKRFRDLYLSGSTINLGGATMSTDPSTGSIALTAKPTEAAPNPSSLVVTTTGATVAVSTVGGTVDFEQVAVQIAETPGFDGAYSSLTGAPTSITDFGITDGTVGQVLTTDGAGGFTFADTAVAYGDSDVATYLSSNGYDTASNIVASITIPSTLTDLGITDGTAGQVLTTDGVGGFAFADAAGGGGAGAVELSGPSQAPELSTITFTITNYDANAAYIISVTGGSATRSDAVITWTLPSVSGDTVHYLNAQAITAGVNSGITTANITVNSVLIDDDTIYISNFYGTKKGWES